MNRDKELLRIAHEIENCTRCKAGCTGKAVPGEGGTDARVMFVGEAPGSAEAKTGRPFVGRSGKFLRNMIRDMGLGDADFFITSPVHYYSQAKPSAAMIDHGRAHLLRQIAVIKPRVVVLLGNTACRALLGRNAEIAKEHGRTVEKDGIIYFITFHPAYANRFPEGGKRFIEDFCRLKELLNS